LGSRSDELGSPRIAGAMVGAPCMAVLVAAGRSRRHRQMPGVIA
jgi:hypothetical protein